MGKKNRKGNREPKKPKQAKLPPQQAASSVAELGRHPPARRAAAGR
jgi:hypothetical protein